MIVKKGLYVLEDKNHLPVISMVGQEDYVLQSFGNMLSEKNTEALPKDLLECLKGGRVRVVALYCDFIHDNDCKKNHSEYGSLIYCNFDLVDLRACDFKPNKAFSKKYSKEYKDIDRMYQGLEKMCNIHVKKMEEYENEEFEEKCK